MDEDVSWHRDAACLGLYRKHGVDLFFEPDNPGGPKRGKGVRGENERKRAAKMFCARCDVKEKCLRFALDNDCYGVWGGTTYPERKRLKKKNG